MNQRSLVGMSMGARKRAARRWLWPDDNRRDALRMFREMVAESPSTKYEYELERYRYEIGRKLRPCPGCYACGIRRFTQPQGFFTDNTHYIEIRDYNRVRLWRLKHTPILWNKRCGPRSVATTHYTMEYREGMVERGEWIELTAESICDGREVVLAKKEKARNVG